MSANLSAELSLPGGGIALLTLLSKPQLSVFVKSPRYVALLNGLRDHLPYMYNGAGSEQTIPDTPPKAATPPLSPSFLYDSSDDEYDATQEIDQRDVPPACSDARNNYTDARSPFKNFLSSFSSIVWADNSCFIESVLFGLIL